MMFILSSYLQKGPVSGKFTLIFFHVVDDIGVVGPVQEVLEVMDVVGPVQEVLGVMDVVGPVQEVLELIVSVSLLFSFLRLKRYYTAVCLCC